jgi:hypothetical protein
MSTCGIGVCLSDKLYSILALAPAFFSAPSALQPLTPLYLHATDSPNIAFDMVRGSKRHSLSRTTRAPCFPPDVRKRGKVDMNRPTYYTPLLHSSATHTHTLFFKKKSCSPHKRFPTILAGTAAGSLYTVCGLPFLLLCEKKFNPLCKDKVYDVTDFLDGERAR